MTGQEIQNRSENTNARTPTIEGWLAVGGKEGERRKKLLENAQANALQQQARLQAREGTGESVPKDAQSFASAMAQGGATNQPRQKKEPGAEGAFGAPAEGGIVPSIPSNAYKANEALQGSAQGGALGQAGTAKISTELERLRRMAVYHDGAARKLLQMEKEITAKGGVEPREQLTQIEVNWWIVAMLAIFFDGLKYIIAWLDGGLILDSISNFCAGMIFWFILKRGNVENPLWDLSDSFVGGLIPYWNLVGQSWCRRMWVLSCKYAEQNAKNSGEDEKIEVKRRAPARIKMEQLRKGMQQLGYAKA